MNDLRGTAQHGGPVGLCGDVADHPGNDLCMGMLIPCSDRNEAETIVEDMKMKANGDTAPH